MAGQLERDVRERSGKVKDLIKEYNKKILKLPKDMPNKPSPLPTNFKALLLADSELWELDRFGCNEKWARDPKTRHAISWLHNSKRATEEVSNLVSECLRYINWHQEQLNTIKGIIESIPSGSPFHLKLLERGNTSAHCLHNIQRINNQLENLSNRTLDVLNLKDLMGINRTLSNLF